MTTAIMSAGRLGDISIAEDKGAIISVRFVPPTLASARKMKGVCDEAAVALLTESIAQIAAYLTGKLQQFDLPVRYVSPTNFQRKVWAGTIAIPYGETRTYRELAASIENAGAVRATGRVLNRNPVALLVPCHRVITSGGMIGGYAYGAEIKESLLELEQKFKGEGV